MVSNLKMPLKAAWCRASTIPSVEKGLREAMNTIVLAGYPVVDVKATLTFGSYHDVDSSEMAFRMAAILGFKDGGAKSGSGHS